MPILFHNHNDSDRSAGWAPVLALLFHVVRPVPHACDGDAGASTDAKAVAMADAGAGDASTGGAFDASLYGMVTTVFDDTNAATCQDGTSARPPKPPSPKISIDGNVTEQISIPGYAAYPLVKVR